ncbi:MAG TPA: uracil-DNA glycosylase [Nitrososphaeraceae archaeon]
MVRVLLARRCILRSWAVLIHSNSLISELDEVRSLITDCRLCKLHKARTNPVPGEGDSAATIMLVGEAPGRKEDELGKPFVGSAGKILDEVLVKAGIDRSKIFITNIVKCRPPDNRVPELDETTACITNYLQRQIHIIRPRVICIMGSSALGSLLGMKSILVNRGKTVYRNNIPYFLTIHPAATIYNRKLRSYLEKDMTTLAKEYLVPDLMD